jgi:hypothetical protein
MVSNKRLPPHLVCENNHNLFTNTTRPYPTQLLSKAICLCLQNNIKNFTGQRKRGFNLFILIQLLVFYKFIMNKVNCDIANKISLFTVLSFFLAMVITPPLLSPTIHGAGVGLKINVHVNGAGKVCAFSAVENL